MGKEELASLFTSPQSLLPPPTLATVSSLPLPVPDEVPSEEVERLPGGWENCKVSEKTWREK